jgi:aryl-alcohol dehydrogenase-like predicted oxidoreductase
VRTVTFGHSGLEITRVGFGAWAVGGGNWEFGWGEQTTRSPRRSSGAPSMASIRGR